HLLLEIVAYRTIEVLFSSDISCANDTAIGSCCKKSFLMSSLITFVKLLIVIVITHECNFNEVFE
ncbi:MAG: hypothetical protein K2X02_07005, partial [Alphaproteobacteria bacterium]|nr:hypothetical protein [Alphaproteobacteria bacterium]